MRLNGIMAQTYIEAITNTKYNFNVDACDGEVHEAQTGPASSMEVSLAVIWDRPLLEADGLDNHSGHPVGITVR